MTEFETLQVSYQGAAELECVLPPCCHYLLSSWFIVIKWHLGAT